MKVGTEGEKGGEGEGREGEGRGMEGMRRRGRVARFVFFRFIGVECGGEARVDELRRVDQSTEEV